MRKLSQTFKALSDETRLRIMALIFRDGPLCVCEVERVLGITQSKASRHLRYLRDAGLLQDERDGLIVNYRLPAEAAPAVTSVLKLVEELVRGMKLPEARPVLVQMRAARLEGGAASPTEVVGAGASG